MMTQWTRRAVLKGSSLAVGASLFLPRVPQGAPQQRLGGTIHLNLNENAFGPSQRVPNAIRAEAYARVTLCGCKFGAGIRRADCCL